MVWLLLSFAKPGTSQRVNEKQFEEEEEENK
jgi:hypothetical protein